MSADILEYVDQKFRSGNSVPIERAHLSVDEWAQLRAEIVMLRGEVEQARRSCQAMVHQSYKDGYADGIAPPEAKGDNEPLASQIDRLAKFILANFPGEPSTPDGAIDVAIRLLTHHPADGGAVAWPNRPSERIKLILREAIQAGVTNETQIELVWRSILDNTNPPAAQVQGEAGPKVMPLITGDARIPYTDATAHMAYKNGWNACVEELAAHHSACELGAVQRLAATWEKVGPVGYIDYGSAAKQLKAALQHRGDSRGGEGQS